MPKKKLIIIHILCNLNHEMINKLFYNFINLFSCIFDYKIINLLLTLLYLNQYS